MTLAERCRATRLQIENRNAKETAHKDAEVFRERTNGLLQIRTSVVQDLAKIEVLRRHGVTLQNLPSVASVKAARETYLGALRSKPTDSSKEQIQFKRAAQKVANELRSSLQDGLASLERDLPNADEAFLRQVEALPQHRRTVEEIRQQRRELLNDGRNIQHLGPELLDRVLLRRKQLRELVGSLNPSEFPASVLAFYKSARSTEGAALDALTSEVREWLSNRNLLRSVRLIVKD